MLRLECASCGNCLSLASRSVRLRLTLEVPLRPTPAIRNRALPRLQGQVSECSDSKVSVGSNVEASATAWPVFFA